MRGMSGSEDVRGEVAMSSKQQKVKWNHSACCVTYISNMSHTLSEQHEFLLKAQSTVNMLVSMLFYTLH